MGPPSRESLSVGVVRRSVWVLAAAGGLLGGLALHLMLTVLPSPHPHFGDLGMLPLFIPASTGICTMLLLAAALKIGLRSATHVRRRTMISCVVLGWLNCPLSLLVVGVLVLATSGQAPALGESLLGLIAVVGSGFALGLIFAMPVGALYGLVAGGATAKLRPLLDRPSHDAAAHTARSVGMTMVSASMLAILFTLPIAGLAWPLGVPLALVAAGAAIAGLSHLSLRQIAHAQFALLSEARSGWERVALDELGQDTDGLLPLTAEVSANPRFALVRLVPGAGVGAYRKTDQRIPWALVD